MALSLILATVSFEHTSGLPKDRVVNTYHFNMDKAADTVAIDGALIAIYNTDYGDDPLWSYMGNQLAGPVTLKYYDLADPTPRLPFYENTEDLGAHGGADSGLPAECALVASYHRSLSSGGIAARKRGRVYIGPLAAHTVDSTDVTVAPRPTTAFMAAMVDAFSALLASSVASASWKWVQYSPTANDFGNVAGGWVDNAFDTQRRRGEATTARTIWP